jgi:alpha-beta hydrolase superfamily lysophospholipase
VEVLAQRYRDAGLTDVTVKVYEGARHEILNETNRDEVTADVVAWLDGHLA